MIPSEVNVHYLVASDMPSVSTKSNDLVRSDANVLEIEDTVPTLSITRNSKNSVSAVQRFTLTLMAANPNFMKTPIMDNYTVNPAYVLPIDDDPYNAGFNAVFKKYFIFIIFYFLNKIRFAMRQLKYLGSIWP